MKYKNPTKTELLRLLSFFVRNSEATADGETRREVKKTQIQNPKFKIQRGYVVVQGTKP
jgi:hypothetical protein